MADKEEKKEPKGARSLYDHDRSKMDKKDERKGEEKTVERKAEDKKDERKGEEKAVDDGRMAMHEKHMQERMDMNKTHETERRDMHGNHREEHRKMAARHEAAHKAMNERHMAEMEGGSEGAEPGATPPVASEAEEGGV